MKPRSVIFLAVILALAGGLTTCTPNGGSIYATIETEEKVVDSTLPKTITVLDMVNISTEPTYPYYVAAGAIYKGTRPNSDDKMGWPSTSSGAKPISPPKSGALCNTLALFNGELWGGFFTTGSILGLYSTTGLAFSGPAVSDPDVKGRQVVFLQATGNGAPPGQLFVCTKVTGSTNSYQLGYSTDGIAWQELPISLTKPVRGVIWDQVGAQYLMVSGSTVYSGTNADPPVFTATPQVIGSDANAIFVDTASDRVFIPTEEDGVWVRKIGTWSQIEPDDVNGNTVNYLAVAGPVNLAGNKYLAGSDGYGYYTLDVTTMNLTRFDDNTILLYASAVRRILVDSADGTVLMGTAGNGLWSATFDPATGDVEAGGAWVHE